MFKKGYLKILEAIISLVLIFSFVVVMIPKSKGPVDTSEIPQELDSAADVIIKQLQSDNDKRIVIVTETDALIKETIISTIKETLPVFTPWTFNFKVECYNSDDSEYCVDSGGVIPSIRSDANKEPVEEYDVRSLGKNVYPKILFITVEDVTENPPDNANEITGEQYKKLTIYFFETT